MTHGEQLGASTVINRGVQELLNQQQNTFSEEEIYSLGIATNALVGILMEAARGEDPSISTTALGLAAKIQEKLNQARELQAI